MGNAETLEIVGQDPDRDGEERRNGEAEVDAVDERSVAVFAMTGAKGLGDQGVQTDEDAFAKESKDNEEAGTDADGTNGFGAVGEAADHHGVDDDHAHPADFGEDKREGEMQGGTEFGTEDWEEGHGIEEDNRSES